MGRKFMRKCDNYNTVVVNYTIKLFKFVKFHLLPE